jgi:hypothetical protein
MEDDTWKPLEAGELIWQNRMPGGLCILLGTEEIEEGRSHDDHRMELYYKVLHPTEGLILDPAYYYDTIEEAAEWAHRHAQWNESQAKNEEI